MSAGCSSVLGGHGSGRADLSPPSSERHGTPSAEGWSWCRTGAGALHKRDEKQDPLVSVSPMGCILLYSGSPAMFVRECVVSFSLNGHHLGLDPFSFPPLPLKKLLSKASQPQNERVSDYPDVVTSFQNEGNGKQLFSCTGSCLLCKYMHFENPHVWFDCLQSWNFVQ